jgi:hypothetical protein
VRREQQADFSLPRPAFACQGTVQFNAVLGVSGRQRCCGQAGQ